ncbi:MAG: COR domain-containing protein [Chloroflexota bacterium]
MDNAHVLKLIEDAKQNQLEELNLSGLYLTEVPEAILELPQLKVLNLGHNGELSRSNYLTELPAWMAQLTHLQSIDLSYNRLTELPNWMTQFTNLQSLNLTRNKLLQLPSWIAQFSNLKTLNISFIGLSQLPDWLTQLKNLQFLDISSNGFTQLPDWLATLSTLQSLNISKNSHLTNLPNRLAQLGNLQTLSISHIELTTLPDWIAELSNLKSLDISYNKLIQLPEWPKTQLSNLQSLNLERNTLAELPDWISTLRNLLSLDISSNQLTQLPSWIVQLDQLQTLRIGSNKIIHLPDWMAQLTNLQTLNINSNNLTQLPNWMVQLTNLKFLNLNRNTISQLPNWMAQLTALQELGVSFNNLTQLPDWMTELKNLQSLNISGNKFTQLPDWLAQFTKLRTLSLISINLSQLPDWIAQLTNLRYLDVSNNKLTQLPEWIGKLTQLEILILNQNKISTLPKSIAQLSNLIFVFVMDNHLTEFPDCLAELRHLQYLYLPFNRLTELPISATKLPHFTELHIGDNPIETPSSEILEGILSLSGQVDLFALKQYFNQLNDEGEAYFYEAKLLIIGEGGAGKTSLTKKLISPSTQLPAERESTDGIDIFDWPFSFNDQSDQEQQYSVNIWDFGGQEVYFATHQFFLTKRSIYILVADTRRQLTDFYTWLHLQETFGGDSPVLLLKNRNRAHGNSFHIDNLPELHKRFPNLVKQIFEIDLSEVPNSNQWNNLLKELKHRFLNLEHIGQPRPATWVKVRQRLKTETADTMTQKEFIQLCFDEGVKKREHALQLSDYLHHLGEILHFQEDPILEKIVILKPTWGLDAVYRVLDNREIVDNWGRFTYRDLRQLWHEAYYADHHLELLRLMINFQLCYPLPEQDTVYIAPQLLNPEMPDYDWDGIDSLQLRYRYPTFMPRGILNRAIVSLHERIEHQALVWRSGVILNNGYARAELLELRAEQEIRIRISGKLKRELLIEIVDVLNRLHRSFPKLRYEKLIPCNCASCHHNLNPHFFDLDKLRNRLAHGKATIECDNPPFDNVQIRNLIDDGLITTLDNRYSTRDNIYNINIHHGDEIHVGNIQDSSGIAIGRDASATQE